MSDPKHQHQVAMIFGLVARPVEDGEFLILGEPEDAMEYTRHYCVADAVSLDRALTAIAYRGCFRPTRIVATKKTLDAWLAALPPMPVEEERR